MKLFKKNKKLEHKHLLEIAGLCAGVMLMLFAAVFVSGGFGKHAGVLSDLVSPSSQIAGVLPCSWNGSCVVTNTYYFDFSASPTSVWAGSATTLVWSAGYTQNNGAVVSYCQGPNAAAGGSKTADYRCYITPGVGEVGTYGGPITNSISVVPPVGTTVYTFCSTANGTNTCLNATVVSTPIPTSISSFAATPAALPNINSGTTLGWSGTAGTYFTGCTLSGGQWPSGTAVSMNSSKATSVLAATTAYTLTCTDSTYGPVSRTVSVPVGAAVSADATGPATISAGQSATISLYADSVTPPTQCGIFDSTGVTQLQNYSTGCPSASGKTFNTGKMNTAGDYAYIFKYYQSAWVTAKTVTIRVLPSCSLSASPNPIETSGGTTVITYSATGTTAGSIDNGIGILPNGVTPTPQKIFITAGSSWPVPADWNNYNNTVECIGAGGGGARGGAGGGGGFARATNVTLSGSVSYGVGGGGAGNLGGMGGAGGTTSFGSYCSATGGGGGYDDPYQNGYGGPGGSGTVGSLLYSGGAGGYAQVVSGFSGAGGGGAAGFHGNGAGGGYGPGGYVNGNYGGGGDAGYGGGGGMYGPYATNGGNGGAGAEYTATNVWNGTSYSGTTPTGGSGGGGGGGGWGYSVTGSGGFGGNYGGGGGGGGQGTVVDGSGRAGGPGLIVVSYVPSINGTKVTPPVTASPTTFTMTVTNNSNNTGTTLAGSCSVPVTINDICTDINGFQSAAPPSPCVTPVPSPGRCVPDGYRWNGSACEVAPPTIINFYGSPARVRKGTPATLYYKVTSPPSICTVVGVDGAGTNSFIAPVSPQDGVLGHLTTTAVNANTRFTLTCGTVSLSTAVGITPVFQEI
jgi:hypothetical protein